jgi:NAD(P)-dependent dehydrogenase (short-subunit alcohol dehydrogenase family)
MKERKVAVITGTATGIGKACAQIFARKGYCVGMLDINETEGKKTEHEVVDEGGDAFFIPCDVAVEASVKTAVDQIVEKYGGIDVLVNNAGIVLVRPFDEIEWNDFMRVVNVNLGGIFLLCKYVLPIMKDRKSGSIVNMSSVSGHVGQTEHVVYGATKGAILSLTRALAWEVAKWNIRVNSISPGSVDTPMLRSDISLEANRTMKSFEEVKKIREAEQAFNRWAEPMEIAEAVYFMASDAASFITGSDLLVDCGWVAK